MPLYVTDYLADTGHLTTTQHGAYLLLIMHYWANDGLPSDEAGIARITRMSARQWTQSRDVLMSLFGDNWSHSRCDHEIAQAIEISRVRSANAQYSHTHTHTQRRKKESIAQESDSVSDWPTDFENQFWQAYPRRVGKQAAMRALGRVKKTNAVPWASMLLAINKFSTWAASKETRFVKHPATWLNAGCWDDELEVNGGLFDGQATDAKDRNGQGVNGAFDTARRNGGQTRGDAILAGMGNIAARLARNGDGRRENVVLPDEGSAGINGGGADVSQAALRIA
jgi:uncharacterized protein YdaU (DUF1376 family)